jgi:hypothetical protein
MDELNEVECENLKKHFQFCPSCQRFYEQNRKMLRFMSRGELGDPSPRLDTLWGNIRDGVPETRRRFWFPQPALKWGLTFGGFLACLMLGFFLGRILMVGTKDKGKWDQNSDQYSVQMVMQNYLEDLKPLVLDLSNATIPGKGEKPDWIETGRIKSMLFRTRLLRKRYFDQKDPQLEGLLDDIELILMEIVNRSPGDHQTIRSVREMMEENDISIKLNLLKYKIKSI